MTPEKSMNAAAPVAPEPWYRHRWPWILIAGPGIVVVAAFVTLWLAIRSDDGLVADDYYKQGLGINRTLARAERAGTLGIVADVAFAEDGTVAARLDGAAPLAPPPRLQLTLVRPTHAGGDVAIALVRGADGRYTGRIPPLAPGRWQVVVETEEWRLPSVEMTAPLSRVTLRADAKAP